MNSQKKAVLGVSTVLLLSLLLAFSSLFSASYEKFDLDEENGELEEHYYESCICIGYLEVMESYPPQYNCQNLEFCRDINRTE